MAHIENSSGEKPSERITTEPRTFDATALNLQCPHVDIEVDAVAVLTRSCKTSCGEIDIDKIG